jgi:glutamate-1-semialdehyde 2,1-aminomutase
MSTATFSQAQSIAAYAEACQVMPGGVNSPVRAFKSVKQADGSPMCPVFMDRASGAYLWDVDGNRYIDYVGSWGPAILGHAHPAVLQRIATVAQKGTTFGAPTLLETELAQLVVSMVPSIQKVRFVNSGTEAVMSAIRLARAYTGRDKLIKFEGCYHGHADALLVKAGSGASTLGIPDSAGTTAGTVANTLVAPYNNLQAVKTLLEQHPNEVAAILIEPVTGNMGCLLPQPGYLEGLRQLATDTGTLLIFDEVMTGFRLAPGGAQQLLNVTPDITTLGKIIGGGLPAAAYGASAAIMAMVAPDGPMYQAGTLSGNPLAMAAGLETLNRLQDPAVYEQLNQRTQQLTQGLQQLCQQAGIPATVTQIGSMFTLFFNPGPIHNYHDVLQSDRQRFDRFFEGMLHRGVYLAPSPFESGFVSLAHTPQDIEATLSAAKASLLAS